MLKKILISLGVLILVGIASLYIFIQVSWNKKYELPYPELKSTTDSALIERGKYLVRGPAHCGLCHVASYEAMVKSERGELVALMGGVKLPLGPLGTIVPANLTPDPETGIGRYEDKEIFRMMRHAVKPDGTATLSPMMPFYNMADEDLVAVVSYLRSMEPVRNETDKAEYTLLGKFVRSTAPLFKPVMNPDPPSKAPPMEPTKERGEYLARYVANCVGCHTPRNPQTFDPIGPEFSGGFELEPLPELNKIVGIDPDLWVRSVNLTPHPNSALSRFKSLDEWIQRFRQGRIIQNSPMQWGAFSRMTDEDLEALWLFLHSLDPVENDVNPIIFKK